MSRSGGGDRPPRLAEWLVRRSAGGGEADAWVVGDLREEYAERRRRWGRAAWLWYWWVVVGLAVRLMWERWREERPAGRRAGRRWQRRTGDAMLVELRQAIRFLRRRPGFSSAIVLTVALAIAATTVAYAVVDGVLFEPLPYSDPDELVVVWEWNVPRDRDRNVVSPANYLAWRERARSFTDVGAAVATSVTRTGAGEPERIGGVEATASVFRIFGARAVTGRLYGEEEDRPGGENVVVLGEGYWRRSFGGDPGVVGQSITLNGTPSVVVGVLSGESDIAIAAEFGGTGTHDVWFPPQFDEEARTFSGRFLQVFARLRPGVALADAQREMQELAAQLLAEFPNRQAGWDVNVVTVRDQVVGDVRTTLLVILGAVCFVLLIACGNVANLLLTRASARKQEMAVRSALGGGRMRMIRQLLLESGLLSITGGVLGLALAYWALRLLIAGAPDIPRIDELDLDASVIAFALLATVVTALLFGLAPALHVAGRDLSGSLKDRGTGMVHGGQRLRSGLVVVQVALSLVLLVGAGLLIRSFANRLELGLGFDADGLLTAEVSLPNTQYPRDAQVRFYEDLVTRVQNLNGVRAASAITFAPLGGGGSATSIWVMDRPVPPPGDLPVADIRWIHRDYHDVMQVPLRAGRLFDERDRAGAPPGVVINESGARQLWPNESALGKRIAMPWGDTLIAEVIGVVGDVLFAGPETELRPMLYWDHRQMRPFPQMTLVVRTATDPLMILPAVRAALGEQDPNLPVFNIRTMDDLYGDALARPRFATVTLTAFASLALLLAIVGIYGVIAYATQQRSREIGIRLALGAVRGDVVRMVLRQGLVLIAFAVAIGTVGALGLSRLLEGLVFNMSTTDPLTFAAMAMVLAGIAVIACWLPARRAGTIDPVEAMRTER